MKLVAALAIAAVTLVGSADASAARRPDLVVKSGSVRTNGVQLRGSFVVRNAGRKRARSSTAALTVGPQFRIVARFPVRALKRSKSQQVNVVANAPTSMPAGTYALRACADVDRQVRERSERNNCRLVGTFESSFPSHPVPFQRNNAFTLNGPQGAYWVYVPTAYDGTHRTPTTLLVWLHGCGGFSEGDIWVASLGGSAQRYITIAPGGREGDCWDPNVDQAKVLGAIDSAETHFNVDRHHVVIGGYSSGGDLAYRTAFYHAKRFAGLIAENTSPFRDTGSTQQQSLAAAAWKFHVVHLAHTQDEVYPIAGVRQETGAMKAAGFPITLIERPGTHYDDDSGDTGTDHDLRTFLLPHLNDNWRSP